MLITALFICDAKYFCIELKAIMHNNSKKIELLFLTKYPYVIKIRRKLNLRLSKYPFVQLSVSE